MTNNKGNEDDLVLFFTAQIFQYLRGQYKFRTIYNMRFFDIFVRKN